MEINDFYDFSNKPTSSTVQAHPIGLKDDNNGKSSHFKLIKGDYKGIDFPVVFKQEYGKIFNDILGTGHAGFYLISNRMKTILEENNLTGWKVFPIKLYDKKNNEIIGYHGFSAAGRCSPTIYDKCKIIERKKVHNGPICKFYKGMSIDKWDGTDFFTPEGTYETFITRKAADVLKKNKITNLNLVNLAESEIPVRYVEKTLDIGYNLNENVF